MSDTTVKPTLTLSALKDLDGAADPGPFVFGVASKRVVFPDPLSLGLEEAEQFMDDLDSERSLKGTLRRWLSEEDYALVTKNLTARQCAVLLKQVGEHYREFLGTSGEGIASVTS